MTTAGSSLSTTNDSDSMRGHLTAVLSTYRIWPVLILLLAGAALASGGIFLRPSNLVAMLFVAAPTTIAALGQTLVIMTAGIDLSVAAVWVLSAVIAAQLATDGWSWPSPCCPPCVSDLPAVWRTDASSLCCACRR